MIRPVHEPKGPRAEIYLWHFWFPPNLLFSLLFNLKAPILISSPFAYTKRSWPFTMPRINPRAADFASGACAIFKTASLDRCCPQYYLSLSCGQIFSTARSPSQPMKPNLLVTHAPFLSVVS